MVLRRGRHRRPTLTCIDLLGIFDSGKAAPKLHAEVPLPPPAVWLADRGFPFAAQQIVFQEYVESVNEAAARQAQLRPRSLAALLQPQAPALRARSPPAHHPNRGRRVNNLVRLNS